MFLCDHIHYGYSFKDILFIIHKDTVHLFNPLSYLLV